MLIGDEAVRGYANSSWQWFDSRHHHGDAWQCSRVRWPRNGLAGDRGGNQTATESPSPAKPGKASSKRSWHYSASIALAPDTGHATALQQRPTSTSPAPRREDMSTRQGGTDVWFGSCAHRRPASELTLRDGSRHNLNDEAPMLPSLGRPMSRPEPVR